MNRRDRNRQINLVGHELTRQGVNPLQIYLMILAEAAGVGIEEIASGGIEAVASWCEHPDFDWYCQNRIWHNNEPGPMDCQMIAIYTHPPGKGGLTESVFFGNLAELVNNLAWCEYMLGEFTRLESIPHDFRVDNLPLFGIRAMHISNSYLGSGKAYGCRMELKRLLPSRFRGFIAAARRAKNKPLGRAVRNPATGLPWHDFSTKKEKFIRMDAPGQDADLWRELTGWISHSDFFDCSIGKHEPHLVRTFVLHQPDFGLLADIPRHSRARVEPQQPPPSLTEALDRSQLKFNFPKE